MKRTIAGKLLSFLLVIWILAWAPAALLATAGPGSAEFDKGIQTTDKKDYSQAMKWVQKAAAQKNLPRNVVLASYMKMAMESLRITGRQ